MKITRILFCVLAFSTFVLLLFSGCSHKEGRKPDNIPPQVKVSGGPPQGSVSNYSVPLYWFGWDDDGVVDHFLYKSDTDTGWTETRLFQGSFLFSADTLRPDTGEFGRWHTFWVKAVDNEGAESYPDFVTFDARTIAPKTTVQSPTCDPTTGFLCEGPRGVGLSVKIVWKGEDPDSRDPRQIPVAYQWRLLNLNKLGLTNGCRDENTCATLLDTLKTPCSGEIGDTCWTQPTTETNHRFNSLQSGTFWLFGVRAIDEAGAIEPGLYLWRNVTYFKTMEGLGRPSLNICEGAVCHDFPGEEWEREAPVGKQLAFCWSGDASSYGGSITGYSYGTDIEDLNDESEWSAWSAELKCANVVFSTPGLHYFYVRVRDYADEVTLGVVKLTLIKFEFDRDLLLIDDYFDGTTDPEHDAFVNHMLQRYHAYTDTIYVFNYYRPSGSIPEMYQLRQEPTLAELSRYKVIIWDVLGTTAGYDVALNRVNAAGNLDVYFKAGGRAWFYGRAVVAATLPAGTAAYPLDFSDLTDPDVQNSFAYRFMKVSGVVKSQNYDLTRKGDGFKGGIPYRKISDALPNLDVDFAKPGVNQYGLWQIETMTSPLQEPDFAQRPDTLYLYRSYSTLSTYYKTACAFRFHDLYSDSKLAWQGFPMHYLTQVSADSMGTFMIDWLFEGLNQAQPRGIASR